MSNFVKTQAKRKRELAKQDKRQAKEQKRAQRKAERAGADVDAPVLAVASVAQVSTPSYRSAVAPPPTVRKPMTLTEAVERWKSTKVAKPNRRS